jgi:hypothetical protein
MADTVRFVMEAMLPELEDLARKAYFTRDEVRAIARRREAFEYALKRRSPVKADFLRCAEYERALDALRAHRRAARLARVSAGLKAARGRLGGGGGGKEAGGGKKRARDDDDDEEEDDDAPQTEAPTTAAPKMTKAEARRAVALLRAERDALRRASPADHGARRRAHFAYERATRRFRRDASLWAAWLDYCRETRSGRRLARVAARALRAMPREPGFWIAAAAWEFDGAGDPHAARALMQRGLRECRRDPRAAARMWEAYAGMEVAYVRRMRARREVLGLALPDGEQEEGEEAAAGDAAAVEAARRAAGARAAEQDAGAAAAAKKRRRQSKGMLRAAGGEGGGDDEGDEDGGSGSSSGGDDDDDDELAQDEDLEEEESEDEEGGAKKAAAAKPPPPSAAELSKGGDDQAAADAVLRGAIVRAVARAASRALPHDLALRLKLARMMDGGEIDGGAAASPSSSSSPSSPPFPGARRVADELWAGIAADFPLSAAACDARARRAFARAAGEAREAGAGEAEADAAGAKAAAAAFDAALGAAASAGEASAAGGLWAGYCAFLRERLDAALGRVAADAAEEAAAAAAADGGKKKKAKPAASKAAAAASSALAAARCAAALFKACARADAACAQQTPCPLPPAFYADTWAGGARAAGQLAAAERAARLGAEARHPASARAWAALLDVLHSQGDASFESALARALDAVGLPSDDGQDDEEESDALRSLWARAVAASPARAGASFARLWAARARRAGPPGGSVAGGVAEGLLEALWSGGGGKGGGPDAARALYARLRLLPPPGGELFRAMARLEAGAEGAAPSAASLRRARAVLEDGAATSYGATDPRLWLQYAELAERAGGGKGAAAAAAAAVAAAAGGGGAGGVAALTAARAKARAGGGAGADASLPTVGDVHSRAVRALGAGPAPRLADEFAAAWGGRGGGGGGGGGRAAAVEA